LFKASWGGRDSIVGHHGIIDDGDTLNVVPFENEEEGTEIVQGGLVLF